MTRKSSPIEVAFEGTLAGMAGALALSGMVMLGRKLISAGNRAEEDGDELTAACALSEGPGMPPDMNRVTSSFVQKVATGIFGTTLSASEQLVAGLGWHLVYGGFWGAIYGLVRSSVSVPGPVLGPLQGLVVWAIGPGWLVPKMQLMLPPTKQKRYIAGMIIGVHLAYGGVVALVYGVLRPSDSK